jgi:hypothetical protein
MSPGCCKAALRVVLPKEPHKKNPIKRTGFFRFFPQKNRVLLGSAQKNRVLLAPVVLTREFPSPATPGPRTATATAYRRKASSHKDAKTHSRNPPGVGVRE